MSTRQANPRPTDGFQPLFTGAVTPALYDLTVSVVGKLAELSYSAYKGYADAQAAYLQGLAQERDLSTLMERQQRFMQTLCDNQGKTTQAATRIIGEGVEDAWKLWSAAATPGTTQQSNRTSGKTPARAQASPEKAAAKSTVVAIKAQPAAERAAKPQPRPPVRSRSAKASVAAPRAAKVVADPATFELYRDDSGQYRFRLKAADGQVLLRSERYKTRASAVNGIETVRRNAANEARYVSRVSASGKPGFNLKAGNHQVIATSTTFASTREMQTAMTVVRKAAVSAKVADPGEESS